MKREKIISVFQNLMWGFALLGLIYLTSTASASYSYIQVSEVSVEVKGGDDAFNSLISKNKINQDLKKTFTQEYVGKVISDIDLEIIENGVAQHTLVRDVSAYLDKDGTLCILIIQRMPIARIFQNSGDNFYIDATGTKVPISPHYSLRTMVVTGHIPKNWPNTIDPSRPSLALKVFDLVKTLSADTFLKHYIDQVHVNADASMSLIPKMGNFEIKIENIEELSQKLANLKIFLKQVAKDDLWSQYSEINIDLTNQIIATKTKE